MIASNERCSRLPSFRRMYSTASDVSLWKSRHSLMSPWRLWGGDCDVMSSVWPSFRRYCSTPWTSFYIAIRDRHSAQFPRLQPIVNEKLEMENKNLKVNAWFLNITPPLLVSVMSLCCYFQKQCAIYRSLHRNYPRSNALGNYPVSASNNVARQGGKKSRIQVDTR